MIHRLRRAAALVLISVILSAVSALPAAAETAAQGSSEAIASVAAKAKPSVVGILTTMKASRSTDRGRSAGTGFVFKPGVIITNAHVVEGAAEVKILYSDKTVETVLPDSIFADATSDVAVVKVTKKNLTPLPFADSEKVQIGQTVIAIGNPLGFRLGNSVTAGILSGTGRALGSGYPFLQMDAPINPGNSGGPLFNLSGEVLGINSAKMADVGVEGLSFAIPANTAKEIAEILLTKGRVERAVLGIALDEGWEAYFGVPDTEGVTIANIVSDGPAGLTGLRRGDKLVKLDETPIYTSDDVFAFLQTKKPGDAVRVTVKRSGQTLYTRIVLASHEELRTAAEEQGTEIGGILIDLTAGQIQEASEFGRDLALGWGDISHGYFATSGSNYAILWTEYLYVARRIASAHEFGFEPGVGFQQKVAEEINRKVEVQIEIHGDTMNFLSGATYTMEQNGKKRRGTVASPVSYTRSLDDKVVIANAALRFSTDGLSPTNDLTVSVTTADGKETTFNFTIKDLR